MITELRRYRIAPDRLDSWLAIFATAARQHLERGIRIEYAGVDRQTSTFIWLRSFADEADRVEAKAGFYGSDWWRDREAEFMAHVLEYEVTFLDASIVREGDEIVELPLESGGEPAGSRGDSPPDGWTASPHRLYGRTVG